MPIYEYQCQHCGHSLEILQKLSDDPATDCPACGNSALKKRKFLRRAFGLRVVAGMKPISKTGNKKNLAKVAVITALVTQQPAVNGKAN